jgi:hypothetical protein
MYIAFPSTPTTHPTTITKARLHVGKIVLRGIFLGRTHGNEVIAGSAL